MQLASCVWACHDHHLVARLAVFWPLPMRSTPDAEVDMSDAPSNTGARSAPARSLAFRPFIAAGATVACAALLAACGAQSTVTVTQQPSTAGSTPGATPSSGGSSAPAGSEPGIV